jgi:hypothetical protein
MLGTGDNPARGSGGWGNIQAVGMLVAGAAILVLLAVFVIYSFAVKEWCEAHKGSWNNQIWGETDLSDNLGDCVRHKSWFSL